MTDRMPYTSSPRDGVRLPALRVTRGRGWSLWLVPLLVLYVVVGATWQPGPAPVRDEAPLLGYAEQLLDGGYVQDDADVRPMRFLWHGPGLPVMLAPLVALELPLTAVRFVGPLLLGAAVLAFYGVLRSRLPPRRALGWACAFGLYGPFLAMLPELHKDLLAVLLVALAMLGLSRGLVEGGLGWLLGAGAALGALALTRGEYGWVLVALGLAAALGWALRRPSALAARRLLVSCLIGLVVAAPWLAYTQSVTGRFFYWSNSAGLSLYWMSPTAPGETGEWHPARHVRADPALRAERPLFRRLRTLPPLEQDLELRRLALAHVRAQPARYARNLLANASRLLFLVPMRYGYPAWLVVGAIAFNALLLVGVAWAVVRLRRRPTPLPPEGWAFGVLAALSVLVHLPTPASPRMLLPAAPLLMWFISYAHGAPAKQATEGPEAVRAVAPPPRSPASPWRPRDRVAAG